MAERAFLALCDWYARYLHRHAIWPNNRLHRVLWKLAFRLYWRVATPLACYGCALVLKTTFFSVYVAEQKARAVMEIYIGRSWLFRGKYFGKMIKTQIACPPFDFAASLSKRAYRG